MSPVAASLSRHARGVPTAVLLAALAAGAFAAAAALAGARLGSAALLLAVPAALAAGASPAAAALAGARLGSAALLLAAPAALAAAAARGRIEARHSGLMHLAHIDPLTGLGNARMLRTRLNYEIARHRRH